MGNRMSLSDQMKANKRIINRAIREMERERMNLEREQKKLEVDIKKMAQQGQMQAVRVMAKDLVRTKAHISKFYTMTSNLKGLSLKLQTMKTSHDMAQAMGKMTKSMKQMNKRMNIQSLSKLMAEFEAQSEKTEMTQEMMDDVMDDVLDNGEGAEEDAIVQKVLDEIGVDLTRDLDAAPTGAGVKTKQAVATEEKEEPTPVTAEVSDLEARLQNLRRDG